MNSLLILCLGIGFLSASGISIKMWLAFATGARGERLTERALAALDDRYLLIRNWVPPYGKKTGDIDQVLLGPHGALVMEIKNYNRATKCEGDTWFVEAGDHGYWQPKKSLSSQLRGNIRKVAKRLPGKTSGVLVFNDSADLTLIDPQVTILRRRELLDHVASLPDRGCTADGLWTSLSADTKRGKDK
ncbi:MAG: NERD domain-containing protein [Armatimonadetes bacterium]|nr:NERD domain-containing protein [Armatimonadota bacterium]